MLCFRDMTFCWSNCQNDTCPRHYGPDDAIAAEKWWGGPSTPVAFSDFSKGCPEYSAARPDAPQQGEGNE